MDNKQVILSDVAIVNSGATFPTLMQGEKEGQYPYYKVSDMNTVGNEVLMSVAVNYVDEDARKELNAKVIERGSIVFPKVGAALRTNKKRILKYDSCMDNNMMAITAMPSKVLPAYLYHLLIRTDLMRFANDANPPSMRKADLERWKISLPPLKEQQRIVEILDRAANIIHLRQQTIEIARQIPPALFYEMFGNPVRNEKGWETATLGDVVELIRNGTTARQNDDGIGSPVSRIETISNGEIDFNRVRYVDGIDESKWLMKQGDILFSHINSIPHIGKTALYKEARLPLIHGMNLLLLRPKQSVVSAEFLLNYLRLPSIKQHFRARANKAVNQASINQAEVKKTIVLLPPMSNQKSFVARLNKLESVQIQKLQSATQTEQLSAALSAQFLAA